MIPHKHGLENQKLLLLAADRLLKKEQERWSAMQLQENTEWDQERGGSAA